MTKTSDAIVVELIVDIAKRDGTYVEGDTLEQTLEKARIKRGQRGKNRYNYNQIGESKAMAKKRQEVAKLAIGSKVRWDSKAGGHIKPMEGEVLAHLPANTNIPLEGINMSVLSRLTFDPNGTTPHDRYLVAVKYPRTTRYSTPPVNSVSVVVEP
jgi:hypothetical protein